MINSINTNKSRFEKVDFVDSLRGIAALCVIVFHLVFIPQPHLEVPSAFEPLIQKGGAGVTLFFVISAFTLCLSTDNRKSEVNKNKRFYLRRFFRIAPLFYFMLIVYVFRDILLYRHLPSLKLILLNISFAYNFYPPQIESTVWAGWTIGVEMIFYLLLPLILVKVKNLQTSIIFVILSLLISSIYRYFVELNLVLSQEAMNKYLYMNFINQLPVFAIGITCYFIYKHFLPRFKSSSKLASILLLVLSILLFLSVVGQIGLLKQAHYHYWFALSFSSLVLSLALYSNKLIVNKFTCFFGKISYSAYLVHPLIIYSLIPVYRHIYSQHSLPIVIQLFLCSLPTFLLVTMTALLTYHLIEEPGIKFGKHIISQI